MPRGVYDHKSKSKNAKIKLVAEDTPAIKEIEDVSSERLLAYTLGRVEGTILQIAAEHDFPPKQFAKRFIEYLYTQASR